MAIDAQLIQQVIEALTENAESLGRLNAEVKILSSLVNNHEIADKAIHDRFINLENDIHTVLLERKEEKELLRTTRQQLENEAKKRAEAEKTARRTRIEFWIAVMGFVAIILAAIIERRC